MLSSWAIGESQERRSNVTGDVSDVKRDVSVMNWLVDTIGMEGAEIILSEESIFGVIGAGNVGSPESEILA